ncbi:NACHT, LRR and PYD domains-containing protein 1b allele 2-like isoform X3 [Arapaima gigas]
MDMDWAEVKTKQKLPVPAQTGRPPSSTRASKLKFPGSSGQSDHPLDCSTEGGSESCEGVRSIRKGIKSKIITFAEWNPLCMLLNRGKKKGVQEMLQKNDQEEKPSQCSGHSCHLREDGSGNALPPSYSSPYPDRKDRINRHRKGTYPLPADQLLSPRSFHVESTRRHSDPVASTEDFGWDQSSSSIANTSVPLHGFEPPTVFTPTIQQKNSGTIYSFPCGHAGWFQCRETNLMFRMKDMGEVVYSTATWHGNFQIPVGWMPAGPLLDIKCPQETIHQIKFPHSEVEDRCKFLSVAHVRGYGVEVLPPSEVTDTHVTVSIADLSLFGLIKSCFSTMICGQVQLFLRPVFEDQERILNVFLLPSNVLLSQVQEYQKDNIHIPTSSICTLIHEHEYSIQCDLEDKHFIQPKKEKFYDHVDGNFYPTFEVFLCTEVNNLTLRLLDHSSGTEVWERKVKLPDIVKFDIGNVFLPDAAFVDQHRAALIERVTLVDPILDKLTPLVHPEACARVRAAATSQEKMRLLYNISFRSGGVHLKSKFFEILKKVHPHLVQELSGIC